MRQLNEAAEALIKGFEELRLVAYDDAFPNKTLRPGEKVFGTLTIGWGHTGPDVRIGMTITPAGAEALFMEDIADTLRTVERAVKVPTTNNQFGVLSSFAFNVGNDAFLGSTLLKVLNAGDFASVSRELAKWNKTTVDGKKIESKGLIRRRAAEADLWVAGEVGAANASVVGEPPDAPAKATDPVVAGAAVAGLAAILSDVAHQLEPLIVYGDTIKWLFLAVSVAASGVAVYARIRAIGHEAA